MFNIDSKDVFDLLLTGLIVGSAYMFVVGVFS